MLKSAGHGLMLRRAFVSQPQTVASWRPGHQGEWTRGANIKEEALLEHDSLKETRGKEQEARSEKTL